MKTGSLKNVAAFEKLVGICNDLGARYNPSKSELYTTALSALLKQAHNSIEAVDHARINYMIAINERQASFAQLNPLAIRIVRALMASTPPAEMLADARAIKRKLNAKGNKSQALVDPLAGENAEPKTRLVSYLDFESRLNLFSQLIKLLQSNTVYAPNEQDLQLPALKAYQAELRQHLQAVMLAGNALASARAKRNKALFGTGGMLAIGNAVKAYIRSVFGLDNYPATELGKIRLGS